MCCQPDDYEIEEIKELNKKIGWLVWYRGCWGLDAPELAIFNGAEYADEKGRVVVDVSCKDGDMHWGYTNQIEFIKEAK